MVTPIPEVVPTTQMSEVTIDAAGLVGAITAELATVADQEARAVRTIAVRHMTAAKAQANAALAAAFAAKPLQARELVEAQARLTDGLVECAFAVARHLHPLATPTEAERIAVLAVGGYGRAEMAPHSDVDLLFLSPWKITPWAEALIETMLYILWDLKLKVGHSTRTVADHDGDDHTH